MKDTDIYKITFIREFGAVAPQEIEDGLLCELPIPFHFYDQRDNHLFVHLTPRDTNTLKEVLVGLIKGGYTPVEVIEVEK